MNKYFFLTVVFLFSCVAAAGPRVVGNGGISVVCRNPQTQEITEAYLLDLFEAENLTQPVSRKSSPVDEQIQQALGLLQRTAGVSYELGRQIRQIQSKTFYIQNPGVGLPLTDDVLPRLIKKGCNYEQIALYDPESDELQIDAEIYNSPNFSRTDAAALWLHEAVYKLDRFLNKVEDSRESRKLTASLFMTTPPQDLVEAFNKRLGQYVLAPNAKVLWVDANQDVQVDLTIENAPNGSRCRFESFMTDGDSFSIIPKKTFYGKVFSIKKVQDVDPLLNGFKFHQRVNCTTDGIRRIHIEKMKATATFTQAGRQLIKVNFPQFLFPKGDLYQFSGDGDLKDDDGKPWVVRYL